jgi:O-antigen/teichoic acid export membrane protein
VIGKILRLIGHPQSLAREIVRGSVAGAGLRLIEIVLGILSLTILARALGAHGLGVFALAMAVNTLLGIPAKAGLPALVIREVSVAADRQDWGRMRGVLTFSSGLVLTTSIVLSALAIGFLLLFRRTDAEMFQTYVWALALIPLMAFGNVRGAALLALRKPVWGQMPEMLIRPGVYLALLATAQFAAPGWLSPSRAMIIQVIASLVAFGIGAAALWRSVPPEAHRAKPVISIRAWLTSALSFSMTAGLKAAQPSLAVLLLGSFATTESAGLFRLAQRGGDLVAFASATITRVASPHLARLHGSQSTAVLQRLVTRAAQASTAGAIAVTGFYVIAGPRGLGFLFGEDFTQSFVPILILSAAQVISAFYGLNGVLMNMARRERVVTGSFAAGLVTQVTLALLLIPPFGVNGAAISMLASFIVWNTALWWAARRLLGIRTTAIGI